MRRNTPWGWVNGCVFSRILREGRREGVVGFLRGRLEHSHGTY